MLQNWYILSHCPRGYVSGILISQSFSKCCFFSTQIFKFQPRTLFQGTQIPVSHQTAVELLASSPPMLWFTPLPGSTGSLCISRTGGRGRWRDGFVLVAGTGEYEVQISAVTCEILAHNRIPPHSCAGRLHLRTARPIHRTGNLPPGSARKKGNLLSYCDKCTCIYTPVQTSDTDVHACWVHMDTGL